MRYLAIGLASFGLLAMGNSKLFAQPPAAAPRVDDQPWLSLNVTGHTAAVRSLTFTPDSKRLCSAGLDKIVKVWNTSAVVRDLRRTWLLERSIRWQVARGLRGSIYSLAVAPDDGLLAIGGYGAMGSLGEILLVDPVQGTLQKVLSSHRQTIYSMAFSADGKWLASLDLDGQLVLWRRGDWQPVVVYDPDVKTYGAARAAEIAQQTNVRPLAMVGSTHVLVPVNVGKTADGQPLWKLQQIALESREARTLDTPYVGHVSAVAVSADGKLLACADRVGNLYLGPLGERGESLKAEATVVSLVFDPRAAVLVAGTVVSPKFGKAQLEVWDTATRTLRTKRLMADTVSACAVSPDGTMLACTGDEHHAVYLGKLDDLSATTPLRATGRRVVKVAFARDEPIYRIAFGTTHREAAFNDYGPLEQSFDAAQSDLGPAPLVADEWIVARPTQGAWRVELAAGGAALQLYRDNVAKGYVRFDPAIEGNPRSYCWLSSAGADPVAIAVGTDVQNSIFICQLAERGACPILRRLRGHNDYVTSVGVSRDLRYLVSGSADGTVRVWSLSALALGRTPPGRWGAELIPQQNQLVVGNIDTAGPLFFKGVRRGDVLARIGWMGADGKGRSEQNPAAILKQLTESPWETQVVFEFMRGGEALQTFQLVGAWQPLAMLFVSANREWAFWTPEGYYDASAGGNTLFGWQVNRGLDVLPDFYRADQFRKKLERPDVLRKLLPAGSVDRALAEANIEPPVRPDAVVRQQIERTPRVEILTPRSGATVEQNTATVRVRIGLPPGDTLARAKLFANGVVATEQRVVEQQQGGRTVEYEWVARLPTEKRNLIQVFVDTNNDITSFGNLVIERPEAIKPPAQKPKLHVLSVGINQYADARIQPLEFAVADAGEVAEALHAHAAEIYDRGEPVVMVNQQVTRGNWKRTFSQLSEKLRRDVRPDDLLVIFMAGHGFVDDKTGEYYFASYDLSIDDYQHGNYDGCISWRDFAVLGDIPCRKLALLDTCHSGAVQPQQRDVKAAIRALRDDVIFTVAASAGHERSQENKDWAHGAFTKALLEALRGRAATTVDGLVMLNDVVGYVRTSVPLLTAGEQNPTAAPEDLLPFVSMRLASLQKPAATLPAAPFRLFGSGKTVAHSTLSVAVVVEKD
ncbi:MAG TPA: hypothetical protein VHZ24_05790 [Pirellulales bacterium]|nr:hypothetical protein [Pirellulales bacterium]